MSIIRELLDVLFVEEIARYIIQQEARTPTIKTKGHVK
jgi:hypothetical protein